MTSPTNLAWLGCTVEESLEPDLLICDPHHHLWEFRQERVAHRYLLDDVLLDLNAGHNVVSTVFIECGAMYRSAGPERMRVIGETEFANGIAAMSASGLYGSCRVAAGIVGAANLKLGAEVGEVLDARDPPLLRPHYRNLRPRPLHIRVQLSGGYGELQLQCRLECIQAIDGRLHQAGQSQAFSRHGCPRLSPADRDLSAEQFALAPALRDRA